MLMLQLMLQVPMKMLLPNMMETMERQIYLPLPSY
jgi:hypothetical protein